MYVSKRIYYFDDPKKDTVEISNQDITLTGQGLDSVLSRITQLADLVNQKNALYDRAKAINGNGSIAIDRLNGTIDVLKNRLLSSSSSWYTDMEGNMVFESVSGTSAMMLTGEGFMIANGKNDDGTWNWRSFGSGEGFTADAIITGYLSADRIEAGTITANKLASDVGSSLDLSSNTSVTSTVSSMLNSKIIVSTEAPQNPVVDSVWIQPIDNENDIIRRWTGDAWVESTISQTDIEEIKSNIRQTQQDVTISFSRAEEDIADVSNALNAYKSEVEVYQRFSADGLELGKTNSRFKAKLDNTKLAFTQDDEEVAYVSNNKLYITEAEVTNKLSIGTESHGFFDWITTPNGMGLRWRG